jgi:hypothetical protein
VVENGRLQKRIALTRSKVAVFCEAQRRETTQIKRGVKCGASRTRSKFHFIANDLGW